MESPVLLEHILNLNIIQYDEDGAFPTKSLMLKHCGDTLRTEDSYNLRIDIPCRWEQKLPLEQIPFCSTVKGCEWYFTSWSCASDDRVHCWLSNNPIYSSIFISSNDLFSFQMTLACTTCLGPTGMAPLEPDTERPLPWGSGSWPIFYLLDWGASSLWVLWCCSFWMRYTCFHFLFPSAFFFPLHYVNSSVFLGCFQGRAVQTARSLDEALSIVRPLHHSEVISVENEGKLVHLTGPLRTDEVSQPVNCDLIVSVTWTFFPIWNGCFSTWMVMDLRSLQPIYDDVFGISLHAVKLRRIVEMYQWVEHSHTRLSSFHWNILIHLQLQHCFIFIELPISVKLELVVRFGRKLPTLMVNSLLHQVWTINNALKLVFFIIPVAAPGCLAIFVVSDWFYTDESWRQDLIPSGSFNSPYLHENPT